MFNLDTLSAQVEAAATSARIRDMRFLLVEDQDVSRQSLRQAAINAGAFSIDAANSYNTAIAKIKARTYEVVLCDYNLGNGRTGQQLLEEVMLRELMSDGVIWIMVTAERTYEQVVAAVELAPADYILKPFTAGLLQVRLARALNKLDFLTPVYLLERTKCAERLSALRQLAVSPGVERYRVDVARLRAETLHRAGLLPEALAAYEALINDIHPFPWARVGKARVLLAQQQAAEAATLLEQVKAEVPDYLEAHDLHARALHTAGQTQQAQEVLAELSARTPRNFQRKRALRSMALETGNLELAAAVNEDILRHDVVSAGADDHMTGARIALQQGDRDNAVKHLANIKLEDQFDLTTEQRVALLGLASQTGDAQALAHLKESTLDGLPFAAPEVVVDVVAGLLATDPVTADQATYQLMQDDARTRPVFLRLLAAYCAAGREPELRTLQRQVALAKVAKIKQG